MTVNLQQRKINFFMEIGFLIPFLKWQKKGAYPETLRKTSKKTQGYKREKRMTANLPKLAS